MCSVLKLGLLEDSLEKGTATHSSILAWRIPYSEDPGRLQSKGSPRVRHDWVTFTSLHFNHSPTFFKLKLRYGLIFFPFMLKSYHSSWQHWLVNKRDTWIFFSFSHKSPHSYYLNSECLSILCWGGVENTFILFLLEGNSSKKSLPI